MPLDLSNLGLEDLDAPDAVAALVDALLQAKGDAAFAADPTIPGPGDPSTLILGLCLTPDGLPYGGHAVTVKNGRITHGHPALHGVPIPPLDEEPDADTVPNRRRHVLDLLTHLTHGVPGDAAFYNPDQPRAEDGRWTAVGREHYQAARDRIRELHQQGGIKPEHAAELTDKLMKLTVAQLHELKRHYGLKASAPNKAALAARLHGGIVARGNVDQFVMSTRSANRAEAAKVRQEYEKEARRAGVNPKHLHQFAAEVLAHEHAYHADRTAMLREARDELKGHGGQHRLIHLERYEEGRQIKGMDEAADYMAKRYPHLFDLERENADDTLFALLKHGNPAKYTEEQAYRQALDHLSERRQAQKESRKRQLADVPFSRA